jgi:hypothetical protein
MKMEAIGSPRAAVMIKQTDWTIVQECIPIPVTGRGGSYGCETSKLPHCLDNQLIDGGEVVSLKRRPPFTPRKVPGTHFC